VGFDLHRRWIRRQHHEVCPHPKTVKMSNQHLLCRGKIPSGAACPWRNDAFSGNSGCLPRLTVRGPGLAARWLGVAPPAPWQKPLSCSASPSGESTSGGTAPPCSACRVVSHPLSRTRVCVALGDAHRVIVRARAGTCQRAAQPWGSSPNTGSSSSFSRSQWCSVTPCPLPGATLSRCS